MSVSAPVLRAVAAATDTEASAISRITLWEGADYAEHADFAWTRNDVEQRLAALLGG